MFDSFTLCERFCKRALRYGELDQKYKPITDVIRINDRLLWNKITNDINHPTHELLPPQRSRSVRKRGSLPRVRSERHKRSFVNSEQMPLHEGAEPAVQPAVKTELSYRNDTTDNNPFLRR